jgi:hypothetical protein
MGEMHSELEAHIPTAVARIQRLLDGMAADRGSGSSGSAGANDSTTGPGTQAATSLADAVGQRSGLDPRRFEALLSGQAATQETLGRAMARLTELKAAVGGLSAQLQLGREDGHGGQASLGEFSGAVEYGAY